MGATWHVSGDGTKVATVRVTNEGPDVVLVQVDPWALVQDLQAGVFLDVVLEAAVPGRPDIELSSNNVVLVWAWTTALPSVYFQGERVAWSTQPSL